MISITIKNFKRGLGRICVLSLVLSLLYWGVPKFYSAVAEGEGNIDDLRQLTEPLRVQADPNSAYFSAWFNKIDNH